MKTISQLLFGFLMTLVLTVALVYAFDLDSAYSEKTEAAADCETVEPEVAEKEIEIKAAVLEEPEVIKTNQAAGSEDEKMAGETEDNEPEAAAGFKPLDIPLDSEVQEYLKAKCEESNIDYAFVLALMDTESYFNPSAKSKTGDYGLMQINRCNHKALSLKTGAVDFLDPYQNIDAGMWMLADLFEKYEEAEPVLMAYHFGEGGARKLWNQGKYTSSYSQAILEKQLIYSEALNGL